MGQWKTEESPSPRNLGKLASSTLNSISLRNTPRIWESTKNLKASSNGKYMKKKWPNSKLRLKSKEELLRRERESKRKREDLLNSKLKKRPEYKLNSRRRTSSRRFQLISSSKYKKWDSPNMLA